MKNSANLRSLKMDKKELYIYIYTVIRVRQSKAGSRSKFLNSENFKRPSKTLELSLPFRSLLFLTEASRR